MAFHCWVLNSMSRVLWYGSNACNADEVNRTVNVCGRLLHNMLHAPGLREQYVTGCSSLRSFPFFCERVREHSSTVRGLDWQNDNKKKQLQRKCVKKESVFSPNEQGTKPGCSVAIATPARQLAFFVEGCAIIFDERSGGTQLQITCIQQGRFLW